VRRLTVVLGVLAVLGLLAPPAAAVPPFDVPGQITEQAGLDLDTGRVQASLDDLRDATGTQLFVVFVDSFDGDDGQTWADRTAQVSGLGGTDVLFAVATGDRRYGYSVSQQSEFATDEVESLVSNRVEPLLADSEWAVPPSPSPWASRTSAREGTGPARCRRRRARGSPRSSSSCSSCWSAPARTW